MLEFENACPELEVPQEDAFRHWMDATLQACAARATDKPVTLSIRIVDENESAQLNRDYRGKDYATNVLSFTNDLPDLILDALDEYPLGDLAICAPVVLREAAEQGKTADAHWAHMLIHGLLHLQGYDHEDDTQAEEMEALERRILKDLGIADPYQDDQDRPKEKTLENE